MDVDQDVVGPAVAEAQAVLCIITVYITAGYCISQLHRRGLSNYSSAEHPRIPCHNQYKSCVFEKLGVSTKQFLVHSTYSGGMTFDFQG